MAEFGRILVGVGFFVLLLGAALLIAGRLGLPLGRLPGDLRWHGRGWSVFAPLGTSLVLSLALTLILAIVQRLRR